MLSVFAVARVSNRVRWTERNNRTFVQCEIRALREKGWIIRGAVYTLIPAALFVMIGAGQALPGTPL